MNPGAETADEHRYSETYLSHERWLSYVQQIDSVRDLAPTSVVEVGIGPGVKRMMVEASFPGCRYVGLDIETELNPDIRADVTALPFADRSFDVGFCCQVLEHLPFERFADALGELKRVSRRRVVISLPDVTPFFYLRARPPSSRRVLPFLWRGISLPVPFPQRHDIETHGQHYWEIGKKGYSVTRILNEIRSAGSARVRHFRMVERHYWHFFLLDIG